jgi:exopolysaccharide biosynthesis polyprenyl glycosylphosphotransferase
MAFNMDGSSESTLVAHSSDGRVHISEGDRRSLVQKVRANSMAAAQTAVLALALLAAVGSISMTHYANGVLAICGFGIAAIYWGTAWKAEEVDNVVGEIARHGLRVAALIMLATVASTLVNDADGYPVDSTRTLFVLLAIASAGVVVLTIADRLGCRGSTQCVMVFGDGKTALELAQQVKREMPWTKVCVWPVTSLPSVPANAAPNSPACAHRTIVQLAPDVALVSAITWEAATATLTSHLAPFAIDVLLVDASRSRRMPGAIVNFAGLSCLRVFPKPLASHQRAIKRAFDIVVSAALIILLLPLLCFIAPIIKLDSRGPILFRQPRVGQHGTHFTIWKFRTMVTQAADLFATNPTIFGDPRLTRFGAVLRTTSLDELPQLLNVLFGSMSLVGPRPHAMNGNQFGSVVANYAARHRVKQGITGLAQVSGWRGPADTPPKIEQRIANDLRYIRRWSIRQDVLIICRTLFALSGRNAF